MLSFSLLISFVLFCRSFGVTLWEIVECGKQPYEQLSNEDVLQSVIEDRLYQLPEPRNSGDVMDSM